MSTSLSDTLQDLGSWFSEHNPQALTFHSLAEDDVICISFYKFAFDLSKYNHNTLHCQFVTLERREMSKARQTTVEGEVGEWEGRKPYYIIKCNNNSCPIHNYYDNVRYNKDENG